MSTVFSKAWQMVVGQPIPTDQMEHQTISRPIGLAVFASDALSSTAYATEEIMVILALAAGATWAERGGEIFGLAMPIAFAISVLLLIVTISYRQTIYAYPSGGGAYVVARDNLGELPAQVAGAALMTDYILTVAVSITAGVAQITSAIPELIPFRVEMAVGVIILMTIVNLRGVKESGRIFAVPTYFFLGSMFLMLGVGIVRYLMGDLPTVQEVEPLENTGVQALTLFLFLRAFSSGCTALTGIEAISNGITAFKEPRSHNAATTLMAMSTILITLFLGVTFMATQVRVIPSENETVISQIARTVYGGEGILYLMTIVGTTLILLMAANTSYADFPRLAALHASDGYLPRQLAYRGSRLVFSWGITALAVSASLLVIITNARVSALIPLYAVGVFLSFTISQVGMVTRFRKAGKLKPGETMDALESHIEYDPHWRTKMIVSAIGATSTFIVMWVFAITKFVHGAWFIVILIPTLVFIFSRIHRHYRLVADQLRITDKPVKLPVGRNVYTFALIDGVHAGTFRIVNFAKSLGHPWHAVHVGVNPKREAQTRELWDKFFPNEKLVILPSPYRRLVEPISEYIEKLQRENPNCFYHVIVGHLAMDTFWEQVLHQNSAAIFSLAFSHYDNVAVTMVPYQIHHEESDDGGELVPVKAAGGVRRVE